MYLNPSYIAFEGIDGCGKTSALDFCNQSLNLHTFHDPNQNTSLGKLLLDFKHSNQMIKALLFTAANLEQKYDNINFTVSDRSIISNYVYSFTLDRDYLDCIHRECQLPKWIIYLDVDVNTAIKRVRNKGQKLDSKYAETLLNGYKNNLKTFQKQGCIVYHINANKGKSYVYDKAMSILQSITENGTNISS